MTRARGLVVALDGPAGAGKSTAARNLAKRLGYLYLDTGATFRALAWKAMKKGLDVEDRGAIEKMAEATNVQFVPGAGDRVLVDGVEVTHLLRTSEIAKASSRIARYPRVREALLAIWREAGRDGGVIVEGRDIGTVVFPDAELKLFLDADPDVRAERRFRESGVSLEIVRTELAGRDEADRGRAHAPLVQAADAVLVDTSRLSPEETTDLLEKLARAREGKLPQPP